MRLKNYSQDDPRKAVTKEFEITVIEGESNELYLAGPDTLKLDRYGVYTLVNETDETTITNDIKFTLSNITEEKIELGVLEDITDDNGTVLNYTKKIHTNNKNKLGQIRLEATYNGITYSKIIKIVPLW